MPVTTERDLLEREKELAALETLLEQARAGRGGLAAIEGPAGIGKTRLLQAARERAEEIGMRVLSARGSELEREFPFGVARQLFEPLVAHAKGAERKALLQGAAGFAATALGIPPHPKAGNSGRPQAAADPSFPVLHGLYWLTSNICERTPLLLAIDDAHWSDAGSLRFVAFLLPRLEELPLLVALAARTGEAEVELLDRIEADALASPVRPAPLREGSVAHLVRTYLPGDMEDDFSKACYAVTGGNPFLVHQLLLELADQGVAPTSEQATRVHGIAPKSVARSVLLRLARLGTEAIELARALAVLGDRSELHLAAGLAGLDIRVAAEATVALQKAAILVSEPPPTFAHPLLRAAVHSELAPNERAQLHRRAAELLAEERSGSDEVASHLLATDPAGDRWVVEALRTAGSEAVAAGATDAAISYLRRALAEPPPQDLRVLVMLELGAAELRRGEPAGTEHLQEALSLTDDREVLAHYVPILARALLFTGHPQEAVDQLDRVLEDKNADRETTLRMEAELIALGQVAAPTARFATEHLARVGEPRSAGTTGERLVLAAAALERAKRGAPADSAAELAENALAQNELLRAVGPESMSYWNAVWVLLATDHLQSAGRALERTLAESRARGFVTTFIVSSTMHSRRAWLLGEVSEAEADAHSALDAARLHDLLPVFPHALAYLIDALVERAEVGAADAELVASGIGESFPEGHMFDLLLFSRGRLRLAQGRLGDGIEDLQEVGRRRRRWGMTSVFDTPWASSSAPALAVLGERERARRLVEEELRQARAWGLPRSIGIALRAAGLVAEGDEGLRLLGEAADALADSPAALERARTLADLGAALRRSGQRREARQPLREALERARRCGATAIARWAHQELEATGERLPPLTLVGVESLTPSERRVAGMAANGLSNRDIAQALFLTVKTVEKHLSSAYRKLDISSRKELSQALSR